MSNFFNNVKVVNSAIRTVIAVLFLGGVGYGGWFGYSNYLKPGLDAKSAKADLDELRVEFEKQKTEYTSLQADFQKQTEDLRKTNLKYQKLQLSMKLLKFDRRVARVQVLKKSKNEKGEPTLLVRFTEMDPSGRPIGSPREVLVRGEKFFIDNLIVTFDDKFVEAGDPLRSCSLCVFKSIFGELEEPSKGVSIDQPDDNAPGVYKLAGQNEFEQEIWRNFWKICNDPEKQKELGIRASYGQAIYMQGEEGRTYEVQLRASGSTSLKTLPDQNTSSEE